MDSMCRLRLEGVRTVEDFLVREPEDLVELLAGTVLAAVLHFLSPS